MTHWIKGTTRGQHQRVQVFPSPSDLIHFAGPQCVQEGWHKRTANNSVDHDLIMNSTGDLYTHESMPLFHLVYWYARIVDYPTYYLIRRHLPGFNIDSLNNILGCALSIMQL